MFRSLLAFVVVLGLVTAAACSSTDEPAEDGAIRITASTALIAEFASIVAGDEAVVTTLIPAGLDVHSFEPAPATVASIADADVVFVNGYNLEEGLLDVVLENVRDETEVVAVSAGLTPLAGGEHDDHEDPDDDHEDPKDTDGAHGPVRAEGDPHFWLDVSNAIHYVEVIRDHLVELDEANAPGFNSRAAAYVEELEALDLEVSEGIGAIPEADRGLVVLHDAYQYFADAYDLELAAALLPTGAQSDPSAGAVVELIELIEERSIPAIFREPQFNASVLETISGETGAEILPIHSTYSEGVETYVELMRANVESLREGLGGE